MAGISGWEALVLALVVLLVVGPDKLPEIAGQIGGWVRKGRELLREAKDEVKKELGDDVDLSTLDPRQYDPRRIVREALADDTPRPAVRPEPRAANQPAPFDDEST